MIAGWAAEGVGTGRVARLPGRVPGLYIIQTDARCERAVSGLARQRACPALFELPETPDIVDAPSRAMTCSTSQGSRSRSTATPGVRALSSRCSTAPGRRDAASPSTPTSGPVAGPIVPRTGGLSCRVRPCRHRSCVHREDLELPLRRRRRAASSARRGRELALKLATASVPGLSSDRDEETPCRAGGRCRRHHGGGRQLRGCLPGRTPFWRRPARRPRRRAPPCGRRGSPSRSHHPTLRPCRPVASSDQAPADKEMHA